MIYRSSQNTRLHAVKTGQTGLTFKPGQTPEPICYESGQCRLLDPSDLSLSRQQCSMLAAWRNFH